jgi:TRAP-type C4-dicarboxylate transport system substrate-binding protein
VTLCLSGAAATRATAQDKVTLRYALEVDPRHPYTRAAEMMSKRASELTNGRLDVQVFPRPSSAGRGRWSRACRSGRRDGDADRRR